MRDLDQFQCVAQVREVPEQGDYAAIVGLEELLEHQNREKLVLSELVFGVFGRVRRQCFGRDCKGRPGQGHRRTRHASLGGFHED